MLRRSLIATFAMLLAGCNFSGSFSGSADGDKPGGDGGGTQTVAIAISPAAMRLQPQASYQFSCAVTGADEKGCNWSVTEAGGGAVTNAGVYTAPAAEGVYHVVATSRADTTKTATATVTVSTVVASNTPWVTGYYAGWFWDQMYPPERVDMTAMTHFVFGRVAPGGGSLGGQAGQVVLGAGTAHDDGLSPDGTRSVEDYLVKRAHDANIKALLMLGGDGPDGLGFLRSTTDEMRPTFVKNIVDYLVAHDYDGVDVDWENELEGNQGMGVTAEEARRRLKALLVEIRAEAATRARYQGEGQAVLVTFPGYAVSINFLEPGGKVEQWQADVANLVDQYNLMSYGVGTAWNGGGWHSWFSGPIFGASGTTPYDLDTSINAYVATGVPRSKIGIGIGFYGIYYGPTISGPRQPTEGNEIFEIADWPLSYAELVRKGYLSHGTLHWDDEAKSSYRVYDNGGYIPAVDPNSTPAGYLSFESERSIAAKGEWVRSTGVGGTILWTINYGYLPDSQTNPLLAAVKQSFLQ